jgi:phosphatidylserine decarboxylase
MRLHREGTPTLLLTLAFSCFLSYAALRWLPSWAAIPLVAVAVALLALVLWFFRVPARKAVQDTKAITSPCDGKVVVIEEVDEPEYFRSKRRQVSIFMSPVNVHVNWNPIAGTVAYARYHAGKYLVAWHPKSSTENERSTVVLKNSRMEILVRQIAGALARRIVTYSKVGGTAEQGAELGFIKFGSRVDVFLPLDARVEVKLGDRVTGGLSVIARTDP